MKCAVEDVLEALQQVERHVQGWRTLSRCSPFCGSNAQP
jgi:hypothetical protein